MGPQFDNAKAISTIRSEKILDDPYKARGVGSSSAQEAQKENVNEEEEPILVKEKKKSKGERQRKELDKGKNKIEEGPQEYTPKVPFLDALKPKAHKKLPVQQEELMKLFK